MTGAVGCLVRIWFTDVRGKGLQQAGGGPKHAEAGGGDFHTVLT